MALFDDGVGALIEFSGGALVQTTLPYPSGRLVVSGLGG